MLGGRVSDICGDTVVCAGFAGIADGIERGDWFVQDEASALCAAALGAAPGDTVADCCAAPGGKSFAAAMAMENKGTVYALDIHKNKLSLIEKGAKKLGIDIICARECDARRPDKSLVGKCRKVLCDAPCSGLGIIGKKPDIRYTVRSALRRFGIYGSRRHAGLFHLHAEPRGKRRGLQKIS